jgi:hypothetical protein
MHVAPKRCPEKSYEQSAANCTPENPKSLDELTDIAKEYTVRLSGNCFHSNVGEGDNTLVIFATLTLC